jgi:mono/diheme cytochrome c family protein
MRAQSLTAIALVLALGGTVAGTALASKGEAVTIPVRADDFRLVDNTGYAQELKRLVDVKAIVLVSQLDGDKGSRKAAAALEALKKQHPDVEFMLLNSSLKDGRAGIVAEAKAQGYSIPVLDDAQQLVGEQLGVSYAGEAYVIEPRTLRVLYHGPVDASGARKKAGGYLAEALADVTAGKPIAVADVIGKGSVIAFPEREKQAEHKAISYVKDVAPILEAKCVTCHQTGGIAPFAMSDYTMVKGFAPMIRETIRTGRMPPWHPDPTVGTFVNDHSLSQDQIRTLVHWVEAGAPRGEGDDPLTAVVHTAPEWPLGPPDLVIDIPAYTVPASGVVQYQYPTAPNPLTEGRWVRAATLMPGDRRAVHHILAGYIPGTPKAGPASAGQWEASYGEYAVGGESFIVPDKLGIYLPAGGSMGFQLHYTPYGKEAVDHSKMGLYFYPKGETPEKVMRHYVIANNMIELPPNTDKHQETAYTKFPKDALLYSVFLHTHYRGESGHLDMIKPDGSREMLINLPRYDFNWQRTYQFAAPIKVAAGSKLVATYLYDNSVRNAANPDPTKTVNWGDQSWEEMHYTSIYYQWTDETAAKPADATSGMRAWRLMGMIDANLDEKVQPGELHGRMSATFKSRFAEIDTDHDGALDMTELTKFADKVMPGFNGGGRAASGASATNTSANGATTATTASGDPTP